MMRAIILSAGRGKRLKPLTDTLPKPLVEIANKPLLEYHLEKLAKANINHVVINIAWLGNKIKNAIGDGSKYGLKIIYLQEPVGGLETAGGIINALPHLTDGKEPFLVINADIYTDYNFANLPALGNTLSNALSNYLAHLILIKNPNFKKTGDFGLKNNIVTNEPNLTFTGISMLHPLLFTDIKKQRLKLAPILRQAITANKVTGSLFTGYWNDIGTLDRLKEVNNYANNNITS